MRRTLTVVADENITLGEVDMFASFSVIFSFNQRESGEAVARIDLPLAFAVLPIGSSWEVGTREAK